MAGQGAARAPWVHGPGCWAQGVLAAPHPRREWEHPPASPVTHIPGAGAQVELGTQPLTAPGLHRMGGNAKLSGKRPPQPQAPQGHATLPGRAGAA